MGKHLTGTWNCHLTQTSSYLKVKTIGRRMSSWADAASISTCSQESTSCVLSTSFNGTTKSLWSWFTNSSGIQLNCHPWTTFVPKSSNCLRFCQTFVVVCLWPTNVKTMWMIRWPVRTKQSHKLNMLLYKNLFFVKFMLSICFLLNDVLLHGALKIMKRWAVNSRQMI